MAAAFLVDGQTEQRFVQLVCPGALVQRLNLNGASVSAAAIARRAATQIRLFGGRFFPIVVLVDLEGRPVTPTEFVEELREAIVAQGVVDQLRVCVAKRMIENWIIADSELLSWSDAPEDVDALHGANTLRRLLEEYDKAGDGPELLRRARPSRMRVRSPSFDLAMLELSGLRCAWLSR